MKKEQAASLDLAQAPQLPWPWALLVAELAAAEVALGPSPVAPQAAGR